MNIHDIIYFYILLNNLFEQIVINKDAVDVVTSIINTFILIFATGLTIYGFTTWRKELKGKHEYELSKQIIAATYSIRDRIDQVRNPFISVYEFKDREEKKYEKDYQKRANESYFSLSNRFAELQKQLDDFNTLKVEAEAVFDESHRNVLDKVNDIAKDLWRAIKLYHDYKYHDTYDPDKHKKYENIINGIFPGKYEDESLNGDDGGFQQKLNDVVNEIRLTFKTHM